MARKKSPPTKMTARRSLVGAPRKSLGPHKKRRNPCQPKRFREISTVLYTSPASRPVFWSCFFVQSFFHGISWLSLDSDLEKLRWEKFEDIRNRLNFWSEKLRSKGSFDRSWTICLETTLEYKLVLWKRCKRLSKRTWLDFLKIRIFVLFMRSALLSCREIWD